MSTQFGIQRVVECPECDGCGRVIETEKIAHRVGRKGGAFITANLGRLEELPDNTRVFPLDNTAQGIETIGDIKEHISQQGEK
tara:strand:+ start:27105 stop:27353 length:249 start_codon:yes stop_codon:yes gene_type:complete